jgi:hypothetical protein
MLQHLGAAFHSARAKEKRLMTKLPKFALLAAAHRGGEPYSDHVSMVQHAAIIALRGCQFVDSED